MKLPKLLASFVSCNPRIPLATSNPFGRGSTRGLTITNDGYKPPTSPSRTRGEGGRTKTSVLRCSPCPGGSCVDPSTLRTLGVRCRVLGMLCSKDGSAAGFWSRAGFRRMQWGWAQWKCGLSQDRSQESRETFRRLCLGKSLTKETGNWSIRLIIRFHP